MLLGNIAAVLFILARQSTFDLPKSSIDTLTAMVWSILFVPRLSHILKSNSFRIRVDAHLNLLDFCLGSRWIYEDR